MNAKLLVAGVAIAVMVAGASSAKTGSMSGNYAAPADPIPYSQMDTYTAAKPKMNHMSKMHRSKSMAMKNGMKSGTDDMGSSGSMSSGSMSNGSMSNGSMSNGSSSMPMNGDAPATPGAATPPTTPQT